MNTARNTLLVGVLAAGISCGGAKSDSEPLEAARPIQSHATRSGAHGAGMGSGEADEMAAMPPELQKFHAVLGPRWHARQGPERMADACGAIAEFHTSADAVAAAPAPTGRDAAAWAAGGKQLTEAVAALDAACTAHDAAGFEPAFTQVHERFHGLLEAGESHHDEH
ncbi:MAG TPA: hypothetical protein VHW23_02840 [Kofleriaceae bacterium]|jgi:hypothetical protein|nr:hypothetical protein [Kofleriaceae bacterium]